MSAPPDAIVGQLLDLAHRRAAAWLFVDDQGRLVAAGGELSRYGLDGASPGDGLVDLLPACVGVTPTREEPAVVPAVACGAGVWADLHLAVRAAGTSVLLLDASDSAGCHQALQQRANELSLELERQGWRQGGLALTDVVSAMGAVVFERPAEGGLVRLGGTPAWWPHMAGRLPGGRDGITPFLDNFLVDAGAFWARAVPGALRSGPWCEDGPAGDEWAFEATAVLAASGRCGLLVQRLEEAFRRQRRTLQQARDTHLAFETLQGEVEKKEVLLHCIVHDLKAPLSVLVGALSLLERPDLDADKRAELIATGLSQGQRQTEMIRLVLDVFGAELAEIESYSTDPAEAPDVWAAVRTAAHSHRPAFENAGVALDVRLPAGAEPIAVVGREDRLGRVLDNLLDNARRHAPQGSAVRLVVEVHPDEVELAVEDEGPGVPEELAGHLFEKLVRGRRGGGTSGLGLYFCRHVVEQWGGSIGHAPRTSGGSRFWIRLPRAGAPTGVDTRIVESRPTPDGR